MNDYYRVVEAESFEELEQAIRALIVSDASWVPLGRAFFHGTGCHQTMWRRPSMWKRLAIFVKKVVRR